RRPQSLNVTSAVMVRPDTASTLKWLLSMKAFTLQFVVPRVAASSWDRAASAGASVVAASLGGAPASGDGGGGGHGGGGGGGVGNGGELLLASPLSSASLATFAPLFAVPKSEPSPPDAQ